MNNFKKIAARRVGVEACKILNEEHNFTCKFTRWSFNEIETGTVYLTSKYKCSPFGRLIISIESSGYEKDDIGVHITSGRSVYHKYRIDFKDYSCCSAKDIVQNNQLVKILARDVAEDIANRFRYEC